MKDVLKYYKDFPKEGIIFVDIIPYLQHKEVFNKLVEEIGKASTSANIVAPERHQRNRLPTCCAAC